jgi:hypothetical protein
VPRGRWPSPSTDPSTLHVFHRLARSAAHLPILL